jgi:DNA-binding response OmpR family regulator
MSRPGYVFPNEEIIETVWGAEGDVVLLKNVVYRLRKKLEEEMNLTELIKTWPGGYSFVDD